MWIILFLAYGFEFYQVPVTCPLPLGVYKPLIALTAHSIETHNKIGPLEENFVLYVKVFTFLVGCMGMDHDLVLHMALRIW